VLPKGVTISELVILVYRPMSNVSATFYLSENIVTLNVLGQVFRCVKMEEYTTMVVRVPVSMDILGNTVNIL